MGVLENKEKKFVAMKIIPTVTFDEIKNLREQLKKVDGFRFLVRAPIIID